MELVARAGKQLGDQVQGELPGVVGLNGMAGAGLLDKDLRTRLGEGGVEGRLHLDYCSAGDLARCQAALWAVIDGVAAELGTDFASDDPATRLADDRRMTFIPGLIPETLRYTDRPTFQQLVELTQSTR